MKNTKRKEVKIAYEMGNSWKQQVIAICLGILLTMLLVWGTMPSEGERLINRKCLKECKYKIDNKGYRMSLLSGPAYIDALEKCHRDCATNSVIRSRELQRREAH